MTNWIKSRFSARDRDDNVVFVDVAVSVEGAEALANKAAKNKSGVAVDGPVKATVVPADRAQVRNAYQRYRDQKRGE